MASGERAARDRVAALEFGGERYQITACYDDREFRWVAHVMDLNRGEEVTPVNISEATPHDSISVAVNLLVRAVDRRWGKEQPDAAE